MIGSGNVATHLGLALKGKVQVVNVFSRVGEHGKLLANKLGTTDVTALRDLSDHVDLNIVCVKDDAIEAVVESLNREIPVVHTSGSIPIQIFNGFSTFGIVYPLQTFSKDRAVELKKVPFLLEASDDTFFKEMEEFVRTSFSTDIHAVTSENRKQIHLAAVFASNFTSYLISLAKSRLEDHQIDPQILSPLVIEMVQKTFDSNDFDALTGPAKRNDVQVIKDQIAMLSGKDERVIYELITEQILKNSRKN